MQRYPRLHPAASPILTRFIAASAENGTAVRKNQFIACLVALNFLGSIAWAAETPETVLIRQVLSTEKSGHRRGNADVAIQAYADHVVVYEGHHSADPYGWTIIHEDRSALARALAADFEHRRYDLARTVLFVLARNDKAIVATQDSGLVIDRQSGTSRPLAMYRLWIFTKADDHWLAASVFQNIADTTAIAPVPAARATEIAAILEREAEAWQSKDIGAIVAAIDEDFVACDAYHLMDRAKWRIAFSDAEEFEAWLEKRLTYANYTIDRRVLYTKLGENGLTASALTQETVSISHEKGSAIHSMDRYVFWGLRRRSGAWKITQLLTNLPIPQRGTEE